MNLEIKQSHEFINEIGPDIIRRQKKKYKSSFTFNNMQIKDFINSNTEKVLFYFIWPYLPCNTEFFSEINFSLYPQLSRI